VTRRRVEREEQAEEEGTRERVEGAWLAVVACSEAASG
jgi:hypothetical protein